MHFVEAKGILSSNNGMNLYRGCTHGCIYCDSRSKCYGFTHDFEDIEVKANAPQLLEKALKSKRKKCMIGTGAMCDPYLHAEEELKLTRRCLELIDKYDNLIVVQTFSKARSMAGMRIGYAISNPTLIKYLNDAKYSFNSYTMNQTSIVCGVEAVKDREYFENDVRKIVETREWAKEELTKLGFTYLDSGSNFIFAKHPEYDAKELFEALKAHDIYVRFWGSERIEQYMRITIGTREEMEQLFAFLKEYMWRGSEQLQKKKQVNDTSTCFLNNIFYQCQSIISGNQSFTITFS